MKLDAIGEVIVGIVKDSLAKPAYQYGRNGALTNRIASKNLYNSITYKVVDDGNGVQEIDILGKNKNGTLDLLSNTYAYFLIYGRNPSNKTDKYGNPISNWSAIKQWIIDKKINLRGKDGRFINKTDKNINSAAFAISKSIGKNGYKNLPQNFVDISYQQLENNPQITALLEKASVDDLLEYIKGL